MSVFKQPEMDILNTYPINTVIPVKDYLTDFVLKNPLNYPYSSYIMKRSDTLTNVPIKSYYNREKISKCIDNMNSRYGDKSRNLLLTMLENNNISFTGVMILMISIFPNLKLMVHRNGEYLILSLIDNVNKHIAMIDKSFTSIMIYNTSDSINVYPLFNRIDCKTIADVSKNVEISYHYYFEFTESKDEIVNQLVTVFALTTYKAPSWFTSIDENCIYKFKDSIMDDYNVVKLCTSFVNCVADGLVEKVINKSVNYQQTVSDLDVLNLNTEAVL